MESTLCHCGNSRSSNHRYCLSCKAKYMRQWRKSHPLTAEQRLRWNCRSYAHVYLKRGKLKKQPCRICGDPNSQMHHADYSKPLVVDWLCRKCYLKLHRELKAATIARDGNQPPGRKVATQPGTQAD